MNLVIIASYFKLADAGLICSRLEAAGFHPFMENSSSWLGGTMSTATQLQIEVPENEAFAAREFLAAPAK